MQLRNRNIPSKELSPIEENIKEHDDDHPLIETVLGATGPLSKNRFRSNLVGISCLFIGLPGLLYLQRGQPFMGFVGSFMGLLSFYSDYVLACPFSFNMRHRRRAFFVDLIWITKYLGSIFVNLYLESSYKSVLILASGIFIGKYFFLDWSANATNPLDWEFRHSIWHVWVAGMAYLSHSHIKYREGTTDDLDIFATLISFMCYGFLAWLMTTITDYVLVQTSKGTILKSTKSSKQKELYLKWSNGRYPGRLDIIRSVTWNGN